jgi:hypothetical protein
MVAHHLFEIHAIQLIARQHDHVIGLFFPEVAAALPDGIGRALEPALGTRGLLGGQDPHIAMGEGVEAIGALDVAVQRFAVELGQHVDLADAAVDAVADRDVDQAVLAGDRHRRLGPFIGQGHQARALSAAENNTHDAHTIAPIKCSAV